VAALLPVVAFAANTTVTTVTAIPNVAWNASNAAALLIAGEATLVAGIDTHAGTSVSKLAGLAIKTGSLTCVPSGPSASGKFVLTMTDSTAALADTQFPRWIAKAFATTMGCHESQVEVWLTAARRLTNDGRRLTSTVNGLFNVYNPNRARNIGLGIGLGVIAPGLGLGLGLGEGLLRDKSTSAPVMAPVTAAPLPLTTTAAPEEGSSMPLWAGILLGLAVLACIGAAVFFGTQKKDKKKRAVKKAAPVVEEVKIVEEVMPMLAPMQTYQPAPMMQSVQYVQQAPQVQYVQQAPMVQTVQAAPTVTYAAPAPAYTSISRGF